MRRQTVPVLSSLLLVSALLAGCGAGPLTTMSEGTLALSGRVHGGQQAVVGATVQLYAAGKTGNGSASTPMLTSTVLTDSNGGFSLTGTYTCASTEDQVYIVASGGNPGLGSGGSNPALVMMDPLGRCGDLNSSTFIYINEVTTVASAYALAPFMLSGTGIGVSAANIGASATNSLGLKNAFLDAKLLVDTATGLAATLPSNLTIESDKLYAFADAIAPCINSNGTGPTCGALFTAATPPTGFPGTVGAPQDTLSAALNIAKNPGNNVEGVWDCITGQPPYPTGLTDMPNDWTMSLTVTGGGLRAPTSLGIDAFGNVWVAGYYGVLNAIGPQGTPLSATGYGIGPLAESFGLTVDSNNNVWISNQENPSHNPGHGSIMKFGGVTSGQQGQFYTSAGTGTPFSYDSTMDFPTALAIDSNNNVMIANFANSSVSIYDTNGNALSTNLGANNSAFPVALAADLNHGVWLANQGDDTITHIAPDGTILAHPHCCDGANGVAVDKFGNAWFANYYGGNLTEFSSANVQQTLVDGGTDGGLANGYPNGVAADAAQNIWVTDYRGTAISFVAGNSGTLPAGTAFSGDNGYGLDANLRLPFALVPDASGNVWVSNYALDNLVMFFGLATPTATPRNVYPVAP